MTGGQWACLLLAGVAAAGGQICITAAYTKAAAKEISVFDYSQIIFAAILGFVFLEQIPDANLGSNYETTAECFMAISNGVADVAVIDVPTAESAALTNNDLVVISLDENDSFENDDEMTNVCIATRKDDTELRDKIQGAMDSLGWNDKAKMDEMMEEAITLQPAAN